MSRKLFLSLCLVMLAVILMGCAAKKTNTQAKRSPTLPVVQPTSAGDIYAAPTSPVSPPTSEPVALPEPTNAPEPTATPEPTSTPVPPPATQPPIPPLLVYTGPVIAHFEAGQSLTITSIRMQDATNGWSIGGWGEGSDHVLLTADGGQTWRDVTPPEPAPTEGNLAALGHFADTRTAWVLYHSQNEMVVPDAPAVWRTQDGGQTWLPSLPLDTQGLNEVFWPSDMVFADAQNGWLLVHVGAGMSHDYVALFRTQDGGQTWARLIDPYGDSGIQACQKTGLVFASAQNGWLTGDCGGVMAGAFLFQTTDGGQIWQPVTLPAPTDAPRLLSDSGPLCSTQSLAFTSPESGNLILRCIDTTREPYVTSYYLYTTGDGGATWVPASSPAGTLAFATGETGWALGRDIFHTADGGQTWTRVKSVNWDGQFSFVSDTLGWAVARAETETSTRIALVQTTDGGKTWDIIHPVIGP